MRRMRDCAVSDDTDTSCSGHCARSQPRMQTAYVGADAIVRPPAKRICANPGRLLQICCALSDSNAIIEIMTSITIRNLEESTKRKLKVRAAMHGHSMEQEAREILKSALREKLQQQPKTGADLVEAIRRRFAPLGGVELELPPREPMRDPDWLKDWK